MLDPAPFMPTLGISVGPMDHPAFGIPFVFTIKLNTVSGLQVLHPSCQINIVSNKYRLAGACTENKPLVPAPVIIVRQDLNHFAISMDLQIAPLVLKRCQQHRISCTCIRWDNRGRIREKTEFSAANEGCKEEPCNEQYAFHSSLIWRVCEKPF